MGHLRVPAGWRRTLRRHLQLSIIVFFYRLAVYLSRLQQAHPYWLLDSERWEVAKRVGVGVSAYLRAWGLKSEVLSCVGDVQRALDHLRRNF